MTTKRPRKSALRRLAPLVLLVLVGVAIPLLLWPWLWGDDDQRTIERERHWRRAKALLGQTLPGTPDLSALDERLKAAGLTLGAPVLIRIFKREFELELWLKRDGRFHRFAQYPICRWSGWLGPKIRQGDKQAPEGFYTVDAGALNPASRWHRSFNLGFPNAYDRSKGRTGSFLMVHGGCSSVGCYAMTDPVIDEIWRLVVAALGQGQKRFQVQVFPFRMTEENLAARSTHPSHAFWKALKIGHDLFEAGGQPPLVGVCRSSYTFASGPRAGDGSAPIAAACFKPQESAFRAMEKPGTLAVSR